MGKPVVQKPSRSFAEYLQEAAQADDGDDDNGDDEPFGVASPTAMNGTPTARSIPTEDRTYLNGLLSPFSPLLDQHEVRFEYLPYASLQPLRKITCVIWALPLIDEDEQRCLFPQVKSSDTALPQNVVVINPLAFGKHIPSHVTLETARLVSRATDTSDWARLYNFHHVIWPAGESLHSNERINEQSSIDSLSRAIAQDAMVELQSSVVISIGEQFKAGDNEDSLWTRVVGHCSGLMEEKMVCNISVVEILDERDSFRDLLLDDSGDIQAGNGSIAIRHIDMKGAIFENLTQLPIDTMPGIFEAVVQRKEPSSTIIGTISLWNNAISHELKKSPDSQITFVELATIRAQGAASKTSNEKDIFRRQGIVSLGRALRQLLLHASMGTEPMISWRESTLTHVLQRRLECSKIVVLGSVSQRSKDYELTLGTLNFLNRLLIKPGETVSSPFRNSNAVHQMSEKYSNVVDDASTANNLHEYARSPQLLEQIVADPRQRLARFFNISSPVQGFPKIDYAASEDDYQAIDYMDYEGRGRTKNNEPIPSSTELGPIDEKKSELVHSDCHPGELVGLRESLELSADFVETETDSVLNNDDGNAVGPKNQQALGTSWNDSESIQVDRPFSPHLPQNCDRLQTGATPDDQLGLEPDGMVDKTDTENGTVHDLRLRGDHSIECISQEATSEQKIMEMQSESQRNRSQRSILSLHSVLGSQKSEIGDNISVAQCEYEHVAAIGESSVSTLGAGVENTAMSVPSDRPQKNHSTELLEKSFVPQLDAYKWYQDEALKIDSRNMLEVEAKSVHNQYGFEQKSSEEDVQQLQDKLAHLLNEKKRIEKIAEEAISSQADLEKRLLESRNEFFKAIADSDLLRRERVGLLQGQEEFRQRYESMCHTMHASEKVNRLDESELREVQRAIDDTKFERNNLKLSIRDNEGLIGDFKNEKQKIDEIQDGQRKENNDLIVALEQKGLELQLKMEQVGALTSALQNSEREKSKIAHRYSHQGKEVSLLRRHLQSITAECAELKSKVEDRDETVQKLQDDLQRVKTAEENFQRRIRELKQDHDRLVEKMILEKDVLNTTRKHLEQMTLSVQDMNKEYERFEKQHRTDQTTISALRQELISENAKVRFANRQREEIVLELRSIAEARAAVGAENATLYRHDLQLLNIFEEIISDTNCGITSRLEHKVGFEEWLVEYKDKMNDADSVRASHEKFVRDSGKLRSKLARLETNIVTLEHANAKLLHHRKICLDELRSGRERVALIGSVEPKLTPTLSPLGAQNSKSGSRLSSLVPELYLTTCSFKI